MTWNFLLTKSLIVLVTNKHAVPIIQSAGKYKYTFNTLKYFKMLNVPKCKLKNIKTHLLKQKCKLPKH